MITAGRRLAADSAFEELVLRSIPSLLDLQQLVTELFAQLVTFVPSLIAALIVWFVFLGLHRGLRALLARILARRLEPSFVALLLDVFRYAFLSLGLVMSAAQIGIDVTSLLAGLGVAGVALGFAAKETLSNVIAGFVILWDLPFREGHWIQVGEHSGRVVGVGLRAVRIETEDRRLIVIPNNEATNSVLVNHSAVGGLRVAVSVGIAYYSDIDIARKALLGTCVDDPRIMSEPAPEVVIVKLNDSSVDLQLRLHIVESLDERRIRWDYVERAKRALDAAGVVIPFPHVQLFFENELAVRDGSTRVLPAAVK